MSETAITQLPDPLGFSPVLFTHVLRDGARKLIEQAIHAELAALMTAFTEEKLEDGSPSQAHNFFAIAHTVFGAKFCLKQKVRH